MKCKLCNRKAILKHHLSYDNYGNEKPYELVDLCKSCHFLVHIDNDGNKIPLTNRELANRYNYYLRLKNNKNIKSIGNYGNIYGQLRLIKDKDKNGKQYLTLMRSGRSVYILDEEIEALKNELKKS